MVVVSRVSLYEDRFLLLQDSFLLLGPSSFTLSTASLIPWFSLLSSNFFHLSLFPTDDKRFLFFLSFSVLLETFRGRKWHHQSSA